MIRKVIIVVLTLVAVGLTGIWLASCTIVGQGFEDYDGIHGVSQTWWYSNGSSSWGWGASDAETKWGTFFIGTSTRLEESVVVHDSFSDFAGFGWSRLVMRFHGNLFLNRTLFTPSWAPVALFASYPTMAFIRGPVRRWRRRRKGLCVNCGYNLTGNVSGICPECGSGV